MPQSTHSVRLDGSTGYIDLGTAVARNTRLTVAAWVKWVGSPTAAAMIVCRDNNSGARLWQFRTNASGKLEFVGFVAFSPFICDGTTTLTAGSWYHLAATFDGTTAKVYVNGTLDGSLPQSGNLDTGSADSAFVGQRNNGSGGSNLLSAVVDDVLIAGSDLGSSVIAGLAAGTTDPTTLTLDGLWRLEEGTGTATADGSGNGHSGTLTGGASWGTDVPTQLQGGGGAAVVSRLPLLGVG